jgi:hypothetical protein
MQKRSYYLIVALASISLSSPLWAHREHCHKKGDDGKLIDMTAYKDEKSCEEAGGSWKHHHSHCHKTGADGKMIDFPEAKNEKACVKAGGTWSDHGHEESAH